MRETGGSFRERAQTRGKADRAEQSRASHGKISDKRDGGGRELARRGGRPAGPSMTGNEAPKRRMLKRQGERRETPDRTEYTHSSLSKCTLGNATGTASTNSRFKFAFRPSYHVRNRDYYSRHLILTHLRAALVALISRKSSRLFPREQQSIPDCATSTLPISTLPISTLIRSVITVPILEAVPERSPVCSFVRAFVPSLVCLYNDR